MANTTNFGWETPDDTDLVKDGAAAIRTLGNSIDTSLVDLKGGTTGQVLAKASNTDMDFSWVVQDDSNAIQNAIVDAKGDLISATAADTPARLAVGTNGQVLTADSAESTGLKWTTLVTGSSNWTLLNAGGTALTGATTITVSSLAAKEMLILVDGASAGSGDQLSIRFNSDSAANYTQFGLYINPQSTYSNTLVAGESSYSTLTRIQLGNLGNNTASTCDGAIFVDLTDKTGNHFYDMVSGVITGGGSDPRHYVTKGLYEGSAAITSVSIISSGTNFDAGTIYIWGAN